MATKVCEDSRCQAAEFKAALGPQLSHFAIGSCLSASCLAFLQGLFRNSIRGHRHLRLEVSRLQPSTGQGSDERPPRLTVHIAPCLQDPVMQEQEKNDRCLISTRMISSKESNQLRSSFTWVPLPKLASVCGTALNSETQFTDAFHAFYMHLKASFLVSPVDCGHRGVEKARILAECKVDSPRHPVLLELWSKLLSRRLPRGLNRGLLHGFLRGMLGVWAMAHLVAQIRILIAGASSEWFRCFALLRRQLQLRLTSIQSRSCSCSEGKEKLLLHTAFRILTKPYLNLKP